MELKRRGAEDRARWLAELAQAIDEAQKVAWRVGVTEGRSSEALELYVQLEAARLELEALRGAPSAHAARPWPVPLAAPGPVKSVPENP